MATTTIGYSMESSEEPRMPAAAAYADFPDGSIDLPASGAASPELSREERHFLRRQLMEERASILGGGLDVRHKLKLLENNRQTLVVAMGGSVRKTENVVYSILVFGGVMVTVLALLTVFLGLPSEIALTFVGTVLGGTIATISQKLGKI